MLGLEVVSLFASHPLCEETLYLEFSWSDFMNMLAQWEDGENHRQIQFSIEYSIENSTVVLDRVTPVKVTFTCPDTNTVLRSVCVHTDKGATVLRNQLAQSGKLEELAHEIGEKNGLLMPTE